MKAFFDLSVPARGEAITVLMRDAAERLLKEVEEENRRWKEARKNPGY